MAASPQAVRTPDVKAIRAAIALLETASLLFLSPLEAEIVRAFEGWEFLRAQEISDRTRFPNTSHFRSLLSNLVERGILQSSSIGYQLVT